MRVVYSVSLFGIPCSVHAIKGDDILWLKTSPASHDGFLKITKYLGVPNIFHIGTYLPTCLALYLHSTIFRRGETVQCFFQVLS